MEGLKTSSEAKSESGLDVRIILKIYENVRQYGQDKELLKIYVKSQRFSHQHWASSTSNPTSKAS